MYTLAMNYELRDSYRFRQFLLIPIPISSCVFEFKVVVVRLKYVQGGREWLMYRQPGSSM
jgi:hypothetical protein